MADPQENVGGQMNMASQVLSPPVGNESRGPNQSGATWGPIPTMTPGMTFGEFGQTGLRQFSGWVLEDFARTLQGRQGAQKYREMRDNSPVIGAILAAFEATMRKVEWRIVPPNDSGEAAEKSDFVEGMMDDMSDTWNDHVGEALSMLPFGYSFHEIVYKRRLGRDPGVDPKTGKDLPTSQYDDGLISWKRLPIRSQDTVLKWFFDENGQVKGVTQQPWTGILVDIPIEKGLIFRAKSYKNNPEGISVLRSSWVPYYYTKRLQEQEAIFNERMSGVPVLYLPAELLEAAGTDGKAASVVEQYKKIVTNVRIDEQMGMILPSNTYMGMNGPSAAQQYKFELVTPTGRGGAEFDKIIQRYSISMMTSVLADFLTLGHEARGTQSLAVTKIDMFFQAMEGYLNGMASVYNRHGLRRIWKLNAFDEDLMPNIEPDLAQRTDLDVLSNFVLRLSQAGMPMFPNEDLQTFLLDAGGLPDVQDEMALQAAGLLAEQLDREDDMKDTTLDNLQNPPQPKGGPPSSTGAKTPLQKMILASVARRMIRQQGPRFGVSTAKRHRHAPPRRA